MPSPSPEQTPEHFRAHGWMRVPGAFSARDAKAMRDVVWRGLEKTGIRRNDRATWTTERPEHLQHLKADPAFSALAGPRVLETLDSLVEGQPYKAPKNWGAFFIAFPSERRWGVARSGWHCDANYTSSLSPPAGVRMHALLGDVGPRCGGTQILSGSHRLVHAWFKTHPRPGVKGAQARELLKGHPYIRDLHGDGAAEDRIERFMNTTEEVEGVPLQVVENTGSAGDVILLHPLVLHVAAPNNGDVPRFLVSGGIDTETMWDSIVSRTPAGIDH